MLAISEASTARYSFRTNVGMGSSEADFVGQDIMRHDISLADTGTKQENDGTADGVSTGRSPPSASRPSRIYLIFSMKKVRNRSG